MRDDFNSVCVLVKTVETSVNGVLTVTESSRTVFCSLLSNIHSIKTEADAIGIGYEIKLKLADVSEYEGEKFCEWNGDRYEVVRTYQNGEMLEITCQRGVGNVNAQVSNQN